jgi:hypothetical protein
MEDLHKTAARLLGIPEEEVTEVQRRFGKQQNFFNMYHRDEVAEAGLGTGRLNKTEPQIQNLPGTLAEKMEMHEAKRGPVTVVNKGRTPGLSAMSAASAVSPVVSMALAAAAERETQGVRKAFVAGRRTGHHTHRQGNLQALLAQAAFEEGMLMMPAALTGPRRTLINVAVRNALRQWRVA